MQLLPRLSLAFSGKHGLITVIEQSDNVVFISMQPNTGGAMVYEEHKSHYRRVFTMSNLLYPQEAACLVRMVGKFSRMRILPTWPH